MYSLGPGGQPPPRGYILHASPVQVIPPGGGGPSPQPQPPPRSLTNEHVILDQYYQKSEKIQDGGAPPHGFPHFLPTSQNLNAHPSQVTRQVTTPPTPVSHPNGHLPTFCEGGWMRGTSGGHSGSALINGGDKKVDDLHKMREDTKLISSHSSPR